MAQTLYTTAQKFEVSLWKDSLMPTNARFIWSKIQ